MGEVSTKWRVTRPNSLTPCALSIVGDRGAFRDGYAGNLHELELGGTGDLAVLLSDLEAAKTN